LENKKELRVKARERLGIEQESIVIGLITSGDFRKRGVDIFFQAIQLLEDLDNLRFLVVGKDSSISKYISKLEKRVRDKLIIQEPIDRVEELFVSTDIVVYPAHFEEFGMVIQEGLFFGIPTILSKNVGASELIKKNRELILPKNSPENIKDILEKLLKHRQFLNLPKEDINNSVEFYRDRVIQLIEELR